MGRGVRRSDLILAMLTVGALAVGGHRIRVWSSGKPVEPPTRLSASEGRFLDGWIWSAGPPHERLRVPAGTVVVYVTSTTCQYCERQKRHIGQLLGALPKGTVLTIAPERPAVLEGYWSSINVGLPEPIAIHPVTLGELGIPGTPTLLVVDGEGRVRSAWLGMVLTWSLSDLRVVTGMELPRFREDHYLRDGGVLPGQTSLSRGVP